MKTLLTIILLIVLTQLKAQTVDKSYIINWIKAVDTTCEPDSVVAYEIDRDLYYTYDTAKLDNRLQQINFNRLERVIYSDTKTDNYVPGKGTIYISTIRVQETENVKTLLTKAKKLFVDKYLSFSQHIIINSKDPVLNIDNITIHYTKVKEELNKIDPKDIYDISVSSSPVPASMYGQNAKNGFVQIWTKKFITK